MVRAQSNSKNQRGAPTDAGNAQRLSLRNARGYLHIDLTRATLLVERNSPLGARKCLLDRDFQATRIRIGLPGVAAARTCATEQAREEIAEAIEIGESLAARASKSLRPVGGRPKLLSIAKISAQLVVGGALFAVAQDFVGLLHLFEFLLGILFLADIRVEFARQLAICPLHFVGVGVAR